MSLHRKADLAALLVWWDLVVGERPDGLESGLNQLLKIRKPEAVWSALRGATANERLKTSDDVLSALRRSLDNRRFGGKHEAPPERIPAKP